ncbi:type VII secretion protein EsxR [Nocardia sp. NPDC051570]|uniref:type VII secretion protein EsxR n=1 Tax=Nocardia sp. NPDC051570 TaxID=3364324 RepID=UPI003791491E
MSILYDPSKMNHLSDELNQHAANFQKEIDALQTAADNFEKSLHGDQAIANFKKAHQDTQSELEASKAKLNRLASAVESALHRALHADGQVGDGFAGF